MSTLILSRRLPPRQLRHWPHQPVGNCNVAPSSLVVQQHCHNAPRTWPHAALAIALAIGLHAALAAWLMADHPQAPEPTPPMPITATCARSNAASAGAPYRRAMPPKRRARSAASCSGALWAGLKSLLDVAVMSGRGAGCSRVVRTQSRAGRNRSQPVDRR